VLKELELQNASCLRDGFNRPINYLRISVTDRCNFRCFYCMPREGVPFKSHSEILTYEEMALVVRAAADLGISKVRLTGGEPLVRYGIVDFVRMLAEIPGIDDLAMTTNGALLAQHALALKEAGLRRVNVSLDTLNSERFARITGVAAFDKVLAGIEAAETVGLTPVKINVVAMRGVNDDEIVDFARLTLNRNWNVRFIELMPLGSAPMNSSDGYLSVQEIKEIIRTLGSLEPHLPAHVAGELSGGGCQEVPSAPIHSDGNGPARYYRLSGAIGTIGFISPVSEHFCFSCNRLRLTSDGRLRPCLLWDYEMDIRTRLRSGATLDHIRQMLVDAAASKPKGHRLEERLAPEGRTMSEIGG